MAYKIKTLQDHLKVPSIRIVSGVFAHHCLSISESSFVLEPCELEAILTDIYFAAQKESAHDGDVDLASEISLSFLLNVYDSNRSSSISVQSAKIALAVLSDDSNGDKWKFLFAMMADHNGCISPRRLTNLLIQIGLLAEYVGEKINFGSHLVQGEVDKCFAKTPGMLGLSEHGLFEWLDNASPNLLMWMDVRVRLQSSVKTDVDGQTFWKCGICEIRNPTGLKFKCTRCWGMLICEKCYLYNEMKPIDANSVHKHKKSHIVKEIVNSEGMPSKRVIGFVKNMKRALNCPFYCRRAHNVSHSIHYPLQTKDVQCDSALNEKQANFENRIPKVYTSTVGKANGNNINDPKHVLQDIIGQLENQNKALRSLSGLLNDMHNVNSMDRRIQNKVDNHWGQIATQINRLKMFKENILPVYQNKLSELESNLANENQSLNKSLIIDNGQMRVFEAFSPIPVMQKECINETTIMEHKKLKKICSSSNGNRNLDSISNVSMSDISTWFGNDVESEKSNVKDVNVKIANKQTYPMGPSTSEDKFNADIESVTTSNNKMKELNADLDSVLDRLQTILANNFALDEACFDNAQLQETANEMEGLLGTLIRGVEQRRTIKGDKI
ncbi:uncharacterized protein LOC143921444 [Arctopsyche grandis]|uniref:uncharacterized protein LOC143921444 n=1 Tax=Arctopsyche grandis TaxID=121162 RepID=UPI00406D71B6